MDLLDSVLRTAKAENFTEKFKASGIDTTTLSLLTAEDLRMLGIEDPDTRQNILNCIANLQIPKEKKHDLLVDEDYVLTVLHCMSQQLFLHYASLSYAMTVEDIILCDIRLSPATKCLVDTLEGLEEKLEELKLLVCPEQRKPNRKYFIITSLAAVPLCFFLVHKFVKL